LLIAISFVAMMLLGVPIAFVLGLVGLFHLFSTGNPLLFNIIPQRMVVGLDNFSLLAIPFFMLLGELMNCAGISKKLIDFARAIVGHLRGGLGYVNVLSSAFLAAMMGSAVAETAAIGKIVIPAMKEDGYEDSYSAALTASASILGPIIPPSMTFIVYGVLANVSIGAMFFAGILPGILLASLFCLVNFVIAKKRNYPVQVRISFQGLTKAFVNAIPSLFIPIIIMGGIFSGFCTATESAVFASAWAFFLGVFVYKEIKIKNLRKIVLNTCLNSSAILFIMSLANIFGWTLAVEQVPQTILNMLTSISENLIIILLIVQLGIDPVHFGIIFCVNMIIGLITPPVGLCLYSVAAISNVKIEDIIKNIWPFLIAAVITQLVVTFWPDFVLIIPRLLL